MVITKTIRKATITAVFMAVTLAAAAHATERVIWKIGTFDGSSGEFKSQDINYADPKSDLVFMVGQSNDKDWYRFQPGPANGIAGGRLHPFTVKFTLNDVPLGVYRLKLAILYETPRLSFLKLEVNGRSGFIYFHPKLDFRAGDWEGTFVPQTSIDEKTISIPAEWLRKGENAFVFTAIDDPATAQNSLGAIAPGHTGLIYDALELVQDDAERYNVNAFSAQIEPTIFYRDTTTGMVEVVDVFMSASTFPKNEKVELQVAGHSFSRPFSTTNEFGEERLVFEVPEWTGAAEVTVRIGTHSASATVAPAKKWTIALIPHEHLDVGFTDYPAKVAELHSQSVDQAMDLIKKTPDFRWTLDGSWVADQYLNGRSPEARKQFFEYVRAGSIVIPPEFANQHTGNASWEALARSFYDQHNLVREYKLPMPASDAAQIVDVPSYTWAYASLLHDAGIKYFVAASNSWRAPVMLLGRWNEKSPFYWEGPDGVRVLMWYSRAYLQAHTLFGGPWRMESIRDSLPVFLQAYTRPDYTANTAIIFGTQLENTPLAKEQSEIVATFSHEYAWPKFEFSTVHSAMQRIEHEWKGDIPVVRGDFGPYWEDGYGSDALHTAIHRENQHRIATAEVMGAAVSSIDTRVRPDKAMLDDAWRNELLYDEHTWTYVSATTQPEHHQSEDQIKLKGSRATRAHDDIDESIQRGWAQLEALVKTKDNSIAVFNSLNWVRSGIVETDLPDGTTLVDASTGVEVPVEVLRKGKGISLPGFGPGNVRVRFVATTVPAVGYKLYTVRPIAKEQASVDIRGNVLENEFYQVTLDPTSGAIASLFDKQLGRELVDSSSSYKFGQYLYVTGGDSYPGNSLYRFGAGLKPPDLTVHGATAGALTSVKKTPIGIVATLSSSAPNTPSIQTEILLPNSTKEILMTYHLHKERVLTRESAYVAFPFAVTAPAFTYGSQAAWVNPAKDELAGGSREWYLPTTWASVYNPQVAATVVPLDAPLVAFGDVVRGQWPAEFKPKSSAIFSWLMNNYWGTNFPAWQGGDFTFRYAITSSAQFNAPSLTRFGLEALTPLERDDLPGSQDRTALPNQEASLLEVRNPGVTLLAWKRAEDGDGTILRLQDTKGEASNVTIHSPFLTFEHAWLCNLLEDNQAEITMQGEDLSVPIKPFQTLTLRLHTTPRIKQGGAQ
jgi:hypothetical protein